MGGLGHELGHALGLPHPPGCEVGDPSCPFQGLMWLGYLTYPDAFLTADDKAALGASPFVLPVRLPTTLPDCFDVPGGGRTLVRRSVDGGRVGSEVHGGWFAADVDVLAEQLDHPVLWPYGPWATLYSADPLPDPDEFLAEFDDVVRHRLVAPGDPAALQGDEPRAE